MTERDATIILEILLAEDLAAQQRLARMYTLATYVMREAPSPEMRTEARILMAEIHKPRSTSR